MGWGVPSHDREFFFTIIVSFGAISYVPLVKISMVIQASGASKKEFVGDFFFYFSCWSSRFSGILVDF